MATSEIETNEIDEIIKQRVRNDITKDAAANKNENRNAPPSTFSETTRLVFSLPSDYRNSTLVLRAHSPTFFVAPALVTLKGLYQHPTFCTSFISHNALSHQQKQLLGKLSLATTVTTPIAPPFTTTSTPIKLITMFEHNAKNINKAYSNPQQSHSATTTLKRTISSVKGNPASTSNKRLYEPTPIEHLLSNNQKKPLPPTTLPVKKLKTYVGKPTSETLLKTSNLEHQSSSDSSNPISGAASALRPDTISEHIPTTSLSLPIATSTTATNVTEPKHFSTSTALHSHKKQKRVFKPVFIQKKRKSSNKVGQSSIDTGPAVSCEKSSPVKLSKQLSASSRTTIHDTTRREHICRVEMTEEEEEDEEDVPMTKPLTLTEKSKRQAARADQIKSWKVREAREARAGRSLLRKQILNTPSSSSTNTNNKTLSRPTVHNSSDPSRVRKKKKRVRFNLDKNNIIMIPEHYSDHGDNHAQ